MVNFAQFAPSGNTIGNAINAFLIVVAVGLVLGIVGFIIYFKSKYKLTIDVEKLAGNNIVETQTKGGIVKDKDDTKTLRILRSPWNPFNPLEGEVPGSDMFRMDSKGGDKLRIFKDGPETFKVIPPVDPKSDDLPKPVDLNWYSWAKQKVAGMAPRFRNKQSFMKEHAGTMSFALVVLIFFLIVVVFLNKAGGISQNLAKISENTVEMKELQNEGKSLDRQIVKQLEQNEETQGVKTGGGAKKLNETSNGGGS